MCGDIPVNIDNDCPLNMPDLKLILAPPGIRVDEVGRAFEALSKAITNSAIKAAESLKDELRVFFVTEGGEILGTYEKRPGMRLPRKKKKWLKKRNRYIEAISNIKGIPITQIYERED